MARNCENCALNNWCENKDKDVCVQDLKPGMHITFTDSNSGDFREVIVANVTAMQNVEFADCDISCMAGLYLTNIKILDEETITLEDIEYVKTYWNKHLRCKKIEPWCEEYEDCKTCQYTRFKQIIMSLLDKTEKHLKENS